MEDFECEVDEVELENVMVHIENEMSQTQESDLLHVLEVAPVVIHQDSESILLGKWKKAVEEAVLYLPTDVTIPALNDYPELKTNLLKLKCDSGAKKFSPVLHSSPDDPVLRAILIELFALLNESKNQQSSSITTLTAEERSLSLYVGGRVVSALHHRTQHSFYADMKEGTESVGNKKNCWVLKENYNRWFISLELLTKQTLSAEVSRVQVTSIIAKWMDQNENSILCLSQLHTTLVSQMLARYVRTRCHRYARRVTQLYQLSKGNKKKGNKGPGTSFRDQLNV